MYAVWTLQYTELLCKSQTLLKFVASPMVFVAHVASNLLLEMNDFECFVSMNAPLGLRYS